MGVGVGVRVRVAPRQGGERLEQLDLRDKGLGSGIGSGLGSGFGLGLGLGLDLSSSTPALVVAAPSKAFVITFWNMTSMSFMPLLKVVL